MQTIAGAQPLAFWASNLLFDLLYFSVRYRSVALCLFFWMMLLWIHVATPDTGT